MVDNIDYKKFWIKDGLQNIAREDSLIQDDWDIVPYLGALKDRLDCKTVLDFGCGYGRFAPAFKPEEYHGIDINPLAIEEAIYLNPEYAFQEVDVAGRYPAADMYLVFTVFLHLADFDVLRVLSNMMNTCGKYIVVIETLGREWRKQPETVQQKKKRLNREAKIAARMKNEGTEPAPPAPPLPIYNRDKTEYIKLFEVVNFHLKEEESFHNSYYAKQKQHRRKNCNTNVLIFGR